MITDKLTITQITDAFPDECRSMIPKVNRALTQQLKPYKDHYKHIGNRLLDDFTTWFLREMIRVFYDPETIERQIRHNNMLLEVLDGPKEDKITDLMIERAKETPLATLYDFEKIKAGHARFSACCPFHNEKTGSFTVYPNNTYYCFGCHAGGDVIEFVRKLHDFKFPEAVKFLVNQ